MAEPDLRACQKSLVEKVFKAGEIRNYNKTWLNQSVQVMTWNQKMWVWMSSEQINNMFKETCILGPLAAMFGREFQQYLLEHPLSNRISMDDMDFSVNSGRASLSDIRIDEVKHRKIEAEREEERQSKPDKRTRSPRPRAGQSEPYKKSPSTRYDVDVRGSQDEHRPRDLRVKEEEREQAQEGLRLPTTSDVRDRSRRASEPRTYTKRPRSQGRQDREDRQKDRKDRERRHD